MTTRSNNPAWRRRSLLVLLASLGLALTLAISCASRGEAASKPTDRSPRANRASLYWGAQIGTQLTGEEPPWDMEALYKFERIVHKKASLLGFSVPFAKCSGSDCDYYSFPTTPMENLRAHGSIPMLSWSSASVSVGTHDPRFSLSKVIAGRYDDYIREFARQAAAWGHPFFLRFNWEMNGNWFPWSEGVNGNKRGQYVAAWRHVHDIFTSVGATNATWVWCPNVGYESKYRSLYPGNKYVDWTCLDGYNWGTRWSWGHWQSFNEIFQTAYTDVRRIAPAKPVMIGEVASSDYGGSKSAWIAEMLHSLPTRYPKVHGVIWFDANDRNTHWPIETSQKATRAFSKGIRGASFQPNLFADLSANPIPPPGR